MTSIFNFFKNKAPNSSSSAPTQSTSSTVLSGDQTNNANIETKINSDSAMITEPVPILSPQESTTESCTTTTTTDSDDSIKVLTMNLEEVVPYAQSDLEELKTLKELTKYKPTVLQLLTLYQNEIAKHVEYKTKQPKKIVTIQIDPPKVNTFTTPNGVQASFCTNNQITDVSHHECLDKGQSLMLKFDRNQKQEEIEKALKQQGKISANSTVSKAKQNIRQLEKTYSEQVYEREKLRLERSSLLSEEELASIEEEEGMLKRKRPNNSDLDDNQWEIEMKRKIIDKERKLIEKRLVEEKKHRNVRFFCKGEFDFLKQWNDCLSSEKSSKSLETMKRYNLLPTSQFDMEGEQLHYRFCESQFHRLNSTPAYASSYPTARLVEVDYIVNPTIISKFNKCKKELAQKHGFMLESMKPLLLFHGTSESNMECIIKVSKVRFLNFNFP